jgi:hypothetical protein
MTTLLLFILLAPYCPSDSARALLSIREIPLRALLFAEQGARADGAAVVEFARLLELAGRFTDAARVYSLAVAQTSPATPGWLSDRLRGVSTLDTILVLEACLRNRGETTVRNVVLMVPRPTSHEPYQTIHVLESDFSGGGPVLTCVVDSLAPGARVFKTIRLGVNQRPHTFRPIHAVLGDDTIRALMDIARRVEGTRADPGPCLEMSRELAEQARESLIPIHVAGGVMFRGDSLVFHAWTVLDSVIPGLPIDPLLMRTDSMMAVGHCPSDMIPLWNLDYTDGCELSALYSGISSNLEMNMRAYFTER